MEFFEDVLIMESADNMVACDCDEDAGNYGCDCEDMCNRY